MVEYEHMSIRYSALITSALFLVLSVPTLAFASFDESAAQGRTQVAALTEQQLDGLNTRIFSDAFITAKIVGFDRSEIDQLKADVQMLKQENAQLRASQGSQPVTQSSSLEGRVTALEINFTKLQSILGQVVVMLTALLTKLQ